MFGKRARVIYAILWGVLTVPAGFFALVVWGLARMDTGFVSPEPQLIVLWALPFILLASCLGELYALRGSETARKESVAKVCAFVPIGTVLLLVVLLLIR